MSATVIKGQAYEDGAVVLMARVQNSSGTNIAQAGVTGITYSVFDKSTGATVLASTSLTVSSVIFDALQTPSIWTADSTGYNFRHDPAKTTLPNGGRVYRFEYLIDPTSGEDFWVIFEVTTTAVSTS